MQSSLRRILVTGGAGFIGSHTVDFLLAERKEVYVLDNLSSGKKENLPNHPQLHFIEGDILNYSLVKELILASDAVLHLAAIVSVEETLAQAIHSFEVNVKGHLNILQAIYEAKPSMRFVYASSAAVYGNHNTLACDDELPLTYAPLSPYALHKITNEHYARLYANLYGINSMALRYFNVYGDRQNASSPYAGVINRFIHAAHNHHPLIIQGDGLQSRDFIYVADVARANYLALHNKAQQSLNIATGKANNLLMLIEYIEEITERKANIIFTDKRPGDIYYSLAKTALAETVLGFKSATSLKKGLSYLISLKNSTKQHALNTS